MMGEMMLDVKVTRAEAEVLGWTRFYTGEACKNGHTAEQYTSSGACVACAAESGRRSTERMRKKKIRQRAAAKAALTRRANSEKLKGIAHQRELMLFDPTTGNQKPYPSHAEQYREHHGKVAWLWNPWTGKRRTPADIGTDTFGELVRPA